MALTKVKPSMIDGQLGGGGEGGSYTLPVATELELGGIKQGEGMTVMPDGTANIDPIPAASETSLGLVQIGTGINVVNGVISVPEGSYELPIASSSTLGGVRPDASQFAVNQTTGVMTFIGSTGGGGDVPLATREVAGKVIIGTGINLNEATGEISVPAAGVPTATNSTLGVVKGGNNVSIGVDGSINVSAGTGNANPLTFTNERGSVSPPPKPDTGYTITHDNMALLERVNMARWFDTSGVREGSLDRGEIMNKILYYTSRIARRQRGSGYYNVQLAPSLECFAPIGEYTTREQIHVPGGVEWNNRGFVMRDNGSFSYLGAVGTAARDAKDFQVTNRAMSDLYVPCVVTGPYAHIGMLNIQGHVRGHDQAGSGFATGCLNVPTFSTASRTERNKGFKKVTSGNGYGPGQLLVLVQDNQNYQSNPDNEFPFINARIRVISVTVNGSATTTTTARGPIAEWEVEEPGEWDVAISAAPPTGHYSNGTTGTGATFQPAQYGWGFVGSTSAPAGIAWGCGQNKGLFCQTRIRDLNAMECGREIEPDANRGHKTGILISGLNHELDRVYALQCRYGMRMSGGSDVRINNWNTVLCGTAWRINGYGAVTCGNFALDSSWWNALEFSGCQGINIFGRVFWENANDGPEYWRKPNQSGYGVVIGKTGNAGQLCSGLNLKLGITNMGGPTGSPLQPAVFVDSLSKSHLDLLVVNSEYQGRIYTNTKQVSHLIEFGSRTENFTDSVDKKVYTNYRHLQEDNMFTGTCAHLTGPLYKGDPRGNYINFWDPEVRGVVGPYGTYTIYSTGNPGSGAAANKAGTGSIWKRVTQNATLEWINTGTRSAPTWTAR